MDVVAALVAFVFVFTDGIVLFIAMATKWPLRICLKTFFVATTVVALQLGTVLWLNRQYYRQFHEVRAILAEHPEIDRIWLVTNDDVELEVEQVFFSIEGQPGLTFYTLGVDTQSKDQFRRGLERALEERQPVVRPDYLPEYRLR